MPRKTLALTLGTLVIIVVVGILISQNSPSSFDNSAIVTPTNTATANIPIRTTSNPTTTGGTTTTKTTTPPVTTPSGYTMAQVATHNTSSNCWTAINGNVYNVTSFISQHPGGQNRIISLCGTDGSSAFDNQHGTSGRPASELASFKIGALIN